MAIFATSLSSCAIFSAGPKDTDLAEQVQKLTDQVTHINSRLDVLNKDLTHEINQDEEGKPKLEGVTVHPADARGNQVEAQQTQKDPDAGFESDEPIRKYREALILFRSAQYSDAILSFTNFLKKHADHALAGAAQYYIGECYFLQREYKLASEEFNRLLVSYDQNNHIPDALKRLAEAQDALNKKNEASRYRQLLFSLFPASPSAAVDSLNSDEVRGLLAEHESQEASAPIVEQALPSAPDTPPTAEDSQTGTSLLQEP